MKKVLSFFILMLLPMVAGAEDAVLIGRIYYNLDSYAKVAEVTSNPNKYTGSVVIPASVTYDGVEYSVTSIRWMAFSGCSGLTSVSIGNNVTSIGGLAFCGCDGLTSITIPNSVTSIGDWAFSYCSGLESIKVKSGNSVYDSRDNCYAIIKTETNELLYGCKNTVIPNSVTSIGDWPFYGCSGLTSITIPNSVTSIGDWAFIDCTSLTSITIPNSVTSIGDQAFAGCSGLTSVTIPNSVTNIRDDTFFGCSGLTSVMIPNSVTNIGARAFSNCSGLTSITIPNSVTSIGSDAFNGCRSLISIIIGCGVVTIYSKAFSSCEKLTDVYCLAKEVPEMMDKYENYVVDGFESTPIEKATLHVPSASINAYKTTPPWKNFKSIVALKEEEIPDNPDTSDPTDPTETTDTTSTKKCATPTIIATGNRLLLECETPDAEFTSYLTTTEELTGSELVIENKDRTYTLTVYATAPGYARSEPATMKIIFKDGDMNLDGTIDVADIATIIDKMAGK